MATINLESFRGEARSSGEKPFGVVILENDHGIERDLNLLSRHMQIHVSRCKTYEGRTNAKALHHIGCAAATILPSADLAAIGYACTSGGFTLGGPAISSAIAAARPLTPACGVADSLHSAVVALQETRISLLTPYDLPLTTKIADLIEKTGITVSDIGFMNCTTDSEIAATEHSQVVSAGLRIRQSSPGDTLFIACNALRALAAVKVLEEFALNNFYPADFA